MTGRSGTQPLLDAWRGPRGAILTLMVLGSVLNPINSSLIAVALVPIALSLDATAAETAWLISGLYFATAIGQPVVGWLVDRYGPRPIYTTCAVLTGTAGVVGLLAPDIETLVVARVLLGLGTCAGYPAAMYLLRARTRLGGEPPTRSLAVLTIASQSVAILGPAVGGLLVDVGGWRATFAVNIPLAVACLVLAHHVPAVAREVGTGIAGFDYVGVALFSGALGSVLVCLMLPAARFAWLLCLGVAMLGAFVLRELRASQPFIDVRIFVRVPAVTWVFARTTFAYAVTYVYVFGYAQWLDSARGMTPSTAGALLVPMFAAGIGITIVTRDRLGVRTKLLVGAVFQSAGCGLLLATSASSPVWFIVLTSLVFGVPQGLVGLANQTALYRAVPDGAVAGTAGLLRTFMYVAALASAAVIAGAYGDVATTEGLHVLGIFALGASAAGLAGTVADRALRG